MNHPKTVVKPRTLVLGILALNALLITLNPANAANSWSLTNEKIARFEAKVVDIACELTGNCPANCGDAKRQLGLLTAANKLILASKNASPFSGAADDLVDFCNQQVIVDGLYTEHRGVRFFAVQFVRKAPDGKWRAANRFLKKWAKRTGVDPAKASQWFRHDPEIKRITERDGILGLGKKEDQIYFKTRQ